MAGIFLEALELKQNYRPAGRISVPSQQRVAQILPIGQVLSCRDLHIRDVTTWSSLAENFFLMMFIFAKINSSLFWLLFYVIYLSRIKNWHLAIAI